MGVISTINQKFINLFCLKDKEGNVSEVKTYYGQKWANLKTNNKTLNSIFEKVDNGDGEVQADELNKLNKIINYIDALSTKDNVLEEKDIEKFQKQLDKGKITLDEIVNSKNETVENVWSEGLDRNITTIQFPKTDSKNLKKVVEELRVIGEEQGFSVEEITDGRNIWIEDSAVRRADGKLCVSYHSSPDKITGIPKSVTVSAKGNKNAVANARVLQEGSGFDLNVKPEEKYYSTSYLEGGNVLNTKLKDGTPAAVVGETSVGLTLDLMGLEHTPENIEKVKQQIATDLGLDVKNVTFIPQHSFHIDMIYRPLHDGEFAIPDYDEGLNILRNLRQEVDDDIKNGKFDDNPNVLEDKKYKLWKLDSKISAVEKLATKSKPLREEANEILTQSGYKLVKIPCFSAGSKDKTNFMNGIGGTSSKTGESFYITNKSEHPELQPIIEQSFKKAGVDKVYFVSTTSALSSNGGLDCLTQEK